MPLPFQTVFHGQDASLTAAYPGNFAVFHSLPQPFLHMPVKNLWKTCSNKTTFSEPVENYDFFLFFRKVFRSRKTMSSLTEIRFSTLSTGPKNKNDLFK